MKNLIVYLVIIISASVLLSSCGHSMSLTKRHYRNGYHFQQANKASTPKSTETICSQKKNEIKNPVLNEKVTAADPVIVSPSTIAAQTSVKERYNTPKYTKHLAAQPAATSTALTASAEKITLSKPSVKHVLQNIESSRRSDGSGLSLFWLVILILLIIWFFGFYSGGWGLGGLINLLLLIAVILLILWLLRVI